MIVARTIPARPNGREFIRGRRSAAARSARAAETSEVLTRRIIPDNPASGVGQKAKACPSADRSSCSAVKSSLRQRVSGSNTLVRSQADAPCQSAQQDTRQESGTPRTRAVPGCQLRLETIRGGGGSRLARRNVGSPGSHLPRSGYATAPRAERQIRRRKPALTEPQGAWQHRRFTPSAFFSSSSRRRPAAWPCRSSGRGDVSVARCSAAPFRPATDRRGW